ncbi:exocyst complex component EXO70H1 isoform X2 [Jatropha curcas]|uniref:exocyst complex component EXO70H1 isoform X1 n=1 Tax=Jatropha curcas TaxID=180498 RepID=UPI001894F97D|nr:exocyst complex component EXO70H1 isoform X1 [Jatropha curcas]XP_037497357.1 exocyst complex component EXO70H1 isoform X2 [Jatropha curcas]
MPRKGMRTIFFKPSPSSSPMRSPPHRLTLSDTFMDEKIDNAQILISKWDPDSSSSSNYCNITSLFTEDRLEAKQYLNSIRELQSAMQYYITENPASEKLITAQNLMQVAMKRLEREFYQILKFNRDYLDPESVSSHSSRASRSSVSDFEDESEDESSRFGDSVSEVERVSMMAMADLKAIADCMISSGYGRECVKIYKIVRKSIVDETLYHLGVEGLNFSQIQKMDWEVLEIKIKSWLYAVKVAVKTLFNGERILCDHVFSASGSMRESCFAEITKEGALGLFGFPENVAKCKKSPEKMFRTLDLYQAIADLWPEIESIFNDESTSTVRSQAVNSLIKLGEAVRTMLTDFESAISKDNSKTPPGGGVHPLTRYVMNYISFLSDYSGILSDIVADWPLTNQSPLPEFYFGSPEPDQDGNSSAISLRLAWLILVLLCKLDGKAELYKDVALSYLFLANNLQYVVEKVRTSSLKFLIGDDWIVKHEAKVKQYASNYERIGWNEVFASLPENLKAAMTVHQVAEHFKRFNFAFEELYKKQISWVVPDSKLRDEIKVSLASKLVPAYRGFYQKFRAAVNREFGSNSGIVRFGPDDLGNYLSDLFFGTTGGPGSVSSGSSTPSFSWSLGGKSH